MRFCSEVLFLPLACLLLRERTISIYFRYILSDKGKFSSIVLFESERINKTGPLADVMASSALFIRFLCSLQKGTLSHYSLKRISYALDLF